MFAGLDGGNPAECVIALAARTLDSLAGVSCSWKGHRKARILGLVHCSCEYGGEHPSVKYDCGWAKQHPIL